MPRLAATSSLKVARDNLAYDRSSKVYLPGERFRPVFHFPGLHQIEWVD